MIRSIRMRPIEKPLILQEIIFNHKEEVVDSNSELSFLKLSQNASKEIIKESDQDDFRALEMKIYKMQQRSALKLNQVKQNIKKIENGEKIQKKTTRSKLIEENKENLRMAFQKISPIGENDNMLECNFQMDQTSNYVKSKEGSEPELLCKIQVRSKEFYSEENSRKINGKEGQKQIRTKRKGGSGDIGGSVQLQARSTDRKKHCRSAARNQVNRQKISHKVRSTSSDKLIRRGRVYEQILSLYSIPKLLAMSYK